MDPADEIAPSEAAGASRDPLLLLKSVSVSEISADKGCSSDQPLPTPRSPDTFIEALDAAAASQSEIEQVGNDSGTMVEELTVRSYRMPGSVSSSSSVEPAVQRGMWQNFARMAGRQADALLVDRQSMERFRPPPPTPLLHRQLEQNYPLVNESLHQSDARSGVRTKVLQASRFPQFVIRNSLKGKGVAIQPQGAPLPLDTMVRNQDKIMHDDSSELGDEAFRRPEMRAASEDLIGGRGGITVLNAPTAFSNVRHDGTNMTEWLKQVHKESHKAERMHVFKQIVELVDISHAQGLVLQQLRPSHFIILDGNQVKYIGSVCPKGQLKQSTNTTNQEVGYLEHQFRGKRGPNQCYGAKIAAKQKKLGGKRDLDQCYGTKIAAKQQKLGEYGQFGVRRNALSSQAEFQGDRLGGIDTDTSGAENLDSDYKEKLKLGEPYSGDMSLHLDVPAFSCQLSKIEFERLEERWYVAPEEVKEGAYFFSSNIYNLGVLLFELFCYFEAWEVHSAAMDDLRDRILPPKFLLQFPKEASFCLLLLHPEPFSRPKSRDILSSGLISEDQALPSLDRSPASIDEEDTEADLLLHFLRTSEKQKEKQAAKLVADLRFLQTDVGEVEKRKLSRISALPGARNLLNDNRDICSYEGSPILEPLLPLSNTNVDKLMMNIDRLQNAYFSMRSRIDVSETNNGIRADIEVLKIRDKCPQVRSYADIRNESTDCLGGFFEGLCKYARYSRFEVCGSVRNVDILSSANVVCSLNFDRDEEYIAAAGVSKKIKIFEFSSLLNDSVDIHYPLIEMSSRSKISCVSWNNYIKNYLASTDYDGVVQLGKISLRERVLLDLEQECLEVYKKKVDSANVSRVRLHQALADSEAELTNILLSLGERSFLGRDVNGSNLAYLDNAASSQKSYNSNVSGIHTLSVDDMQLWDASSGQAFTQYSEHQNRAWSVDFSQTDPTKLASGSDDCSVKLWTINEKICINTIRSKTNVCCVQFSPYSSQLLAFGSADYKIYCYDLRYSRVPWCTLSGHEKTVSYLKFVDSETVVSASTDNTLKLWDLNKSGAAGLSMDACTLTFSGHTNEKNFVGLSVSDGYISCGSETNEVYAYYKTLPTPITSYKFGSINPVTGHETGDDNTQFVSSVCWRGKSNMLVAANSRGTIKLLQLV